MPLSLGALQQMVEQNDDKNEDAHKRLRTDLRELEQTVHELSQNVMALSRQVSLLAAAPPPDATALRFPLPLVATIVAGFLSIGFGMYQFRADVVTRLESQAVSEANSVKVMDLNYQNLKETIKTLDQQQRLQYAEFQTFRQEMARRSR